MTSNPAVVIMGAPGAGKGTQSDRIVETYGVDHVTTGDALRANKDMETEHGTPREYMEAGELVPDGVVNAIVEEALADADGFVLDGYPRTIDQAEFLADVADLDVVLYLDVDREVLVDRLTGRRVCDDCGTTFHVEFEPPAQAGVCDRCGGELVQREDDTPEVVETRIEEYEQKTAPVVDHYEDAGRLRRVDGDAAPDEVFENVRSVIDAAVGD